MDQGDLAIFNTFINEDLTLLEEEKMILALIAKEEKVLESLPVEDAKSIVLECNICTKSQINVRFNPCGHCCFCSVCARAYIKDNINCPLCKKYISGIEPLYLSFKLADNSTTNLEELQKKSKRRLEEMETKAAADRERIRQKIQKTRAETDVTTETPRVEGEGSVIIHTVRVATPVAEVFRNTFDDLIEWIR